MTETIDQLREALSDRYEVQKQIGEGGMATVFLARDLKHKRDVAIKALKPELSATIGKERFHREIEIAARLQHPHVLPVYDSGDAHGVLYYVMPFVKGESLSERIHRGPVSTNEALRITREVASALDYAHREGVVHRDIKPANILLSQGHAMVADFGIARAVSGAGDAATEGGGGRGLTQVGMTIGTPWYMSPEQATADPNVDGRTDVYALGCVLFELLEGRPPFDGPTAQAVIAQTISSPTPTMDDLAGQVPDTVPDAIRHALEKNPDDRFATAGEFGEALDLSTAEFSSARRPAHNRVLGGAVAVGVIVIATLALVLRGSGGAVAAGADVIAVLPFDVSGSHTELGEGMVNLLSTNLNAVGAVRTVDARTVLQRWRSRGGEDGLDLAGSLAVGRDAEAGSVILGSIVEAGTGVRLTAEMYTTAGEELTRVQLDGDADNVLQLVDSLSLAILRDIWTSSEPMPSFDVASITSGSVEAIRAYMRGSLQFRTGQWHDAVTSFQEAVSIDSTFAMAYLALSEGYGWTGQHGSDAQAETIQRAKQFAERLPPRERLLVEAYALNREASPAALDSIARYTERYPSDPRGWYALGDFQNHSQTPYAYERRLEPFDRAIALDSSMAVALVHPMEIAIIEGDRERFRQYYELNEAAGADDRGLGLVEKVVWGSEEESRQALDSLGTAGYGLQFAIGGGLAANPGVVPYAIELIEGRLDNSINAVANAGYMLAMAGIAIGQFEPVTRRIDAIMNLESTDLRTVGALVRVLAVVGGVARPEFAEGAVAVFEELQGPPAAGYIGAVLALSQGDAVTARSLAPVNPNNPEQLSPNLRALSGWASLIEGDTAQGIADLRQALDSIPGGGMGGAQIANSFRLQLAMALVRDPATRDEGISTLRDGLAIQSAPEVYPARLLALAKALELAGDIAGAREAYADFVTLWQNADPELQPRVESVRQEIERLTRAAR